MLPVSASSNLSSSSVSLSPFWKTRLDEVTQKIRGFERKLGIEHQCQVKFEGPNTTPYARPTHNICNLPPWWLLKQEDIPQNLRITDINDPRLSDKKFLKEIADWMNNKLKEIDPANEEKIKTNTLRLVLRLMTDSQKFEKSKDFVVSHELSHLSRSDEIVGQVIGNIKIGLVVVLAVASTIITGIIAAGVVALTVASPWLYLGAIALGVTAISVSIYAGKRLYYHFKQVPALLLEEKTADLDAVKVMGEPTGGVYFFEKYVELVKDRIKHIANKVGTYNETTGSLTPTWDKLPSISITDPVGACRKIVKHFRRIVNVWKADKSGNNPNDLEHPPITERIRYLKAASAN